MYTFQPDSTATPSRRMPVAEVERDLILATLRQTGGNRTHAANVLGISTRTMRNKLNAYMEAGNPYRSADLSACLPRPLHWR